MKRSRLCGSGLASCDHLLSDAFLAAFEVHLSVVSGYQVSDLFQVQGGED
jgi:hypothetical protein